VTPGARIVAMLVGVAGMVVALAGAVREVVLAADDGLRWQPSPELRRLTEEPYWATWVVAAVAAALAVALIALAVRQFRAADGGPLLIQFQDEAGWARLDVRAMERGMRRSLQIALPGVHVHDLQLRKTGDVWHVKVGADVPARDLRGLRARMHALLSDDLERTGGMRLQRLDLVVGSLEPGL
jgi:hypothetical protein